jgi:hypothetical protein
LKAFNPKTELEKLKEGLKDKVKSMETKVEESESQNVFLNYQMGNMNIEGDLQIQKIKMEYESEMNNLFDEIGTKVCLSVDGLKKLYDYKELELEFIKEDLQNKEGELEDVASD